MTNRKVRIAIVDDDPRLLNALRINFKARGYEVFVAGTGAKGLQVVSRNEPDVVILIWACPTWTAPWCWTGSAAGPRYPW